MPIVYFEHGDGYLVVASSGGAKAEPQWIRNLRSSGRAHIQLGDRGLDVQAHIPTGADRDAWWHDVVLARAPFFTKHEQKSGRVIPVAVLSASHA